MSRKSGGRPRRGPSVGAVPSTPESRARLSRTRPALKIWLETDEGYVIGQGTYDLLCKIEAYGSLSKAARSLGMSYRHAWGLINRMNARIGGKVLQTRKGGKLGGGGAELTDLGRALLQEFHKSRDAFLGGTSEHPIEKAMGWVRGKVLSVSYKGDRVEAKLSGRITLSLDRNSPAVRRLGVRDVLTTKILAATVTRDETDGRRRKKPSE